MELFKVMLNRRSVRKYTQEPIPNEKIDAILKAGLASPSGRAIKPWEFVVIQDKQVLKKLAKVRITGAQMLEQADCAIIVVGDSTKTDVWAEDCSIAMANMHLMADAIGVGSCWIQGRLRMASEEETTEAAVQKLLGIPEHMKLEAILSLGMPDAHPAPHKEEELIMDKVHYERY